MFKKSAILVVALAIVFGLPACGPSPQDATPIPKPTPEEIELKYDDGTSDGSCSSGYQGFSTRFSPPDTHFTIRKVKVFTNLRGTGDEGRKPRLEICDKDFNILLAHEISYSGFSSEPTWVTIEIPELTVDNDFYVVLYTNSNREDGIYIHYDFSVKNKHSEMMEGIRVVEWVWERIPKEKTNWMIRVMGTPND